MHTEQTEQIEDTLREADGASVNVSTGGHPIITIMHASVGSGHKAAANAVAQAVDQLVAQRAQVLIGNGVCGT